MTVKLNIEIEQYGEDEDTFIAILLDGIKPVIVSNGDSPYCALKQLACDLEDKEYFRAEEE